jgi:8-oxo-dGTP diphosphatase
MKKQDVIVSGILSDGNRVMLARRPSHKKIAPGKYHLPGGHVEFDEEPADALRREFWEEFKIDIVICRPIRTFSYTIDDLHTVGITYVVEAAVLPIRPIIDARDTEEIVWVDQGSHLSYLAIDDHDAITLASYYQDVSVG